MLIKSICLAAILILFRSNFECNAQTFDGNLANLSEVKNHPVAGKAGYDIRELFLGDIVPGELEINNIVNSSTPKVKISAFRGKLLILDFWATWCGPCISAFPKIDSLNEKFQNSLSILLITAEDKEKVSNFFKKMERIKGKLYSSATDDKVLNRIFKHTSIPHYVWIDDKGKVIAITSSDEINEKNIQNVLSGQNPSFAMKNDATQKIIGIPALKPSIKVAGIENPDIKRLPDSSLVMYSTLTRYVEGLGNGAIMRGPHILVKNWTILALYKIALLGSGIELINNSTIDVEVEDSIIYYQITGIDNLNSTRTSLEYLQFLKQYGYSYEINVPTALTDDKFNIMLRDLNSYFGVLYGIEGVIQEKPKKYLALTHVDTSKVISSIGGKPLVGLDKFSLKIQNMKLESLVSQLALPLQSYPLIINETFFKQNVDLEINCDLSKLDQVNSELKKYGLQLIEKQKQMKIAVIRMRSKQNLNN